MARRYDPNSNNVEGEPVKDEPQIGLAREYANDKPHDVGDETNQDGVHDKPLRRG